MARLDVVAEHGTRHNLLGFFAVTQHDHVAGALEGDALVFDPQRGTLAQADNGNLLVHRQIFVQTHLTGFATVAVFDLDDSLTEENWAYLMDEGDVIPCSFTGRIKGERFEELGFGRCFTAPQ